MTTATCQRWAGLVVAAVAMLGAGCLQRAVRDEPPLVGEVHVEGANAIPEGDTKGKLAITETGRRACVAEDDWCLVKGDRFTFEADGLKADARRIERFYARRGFFETRTTDVRVLENDGRVDVTFVVTEGRRSTLKKLVFLGLEPLPADDRERLVAGLPLKQGDAFDEDLYDDTKDDTLARLRGLGFAEAAVEGKVFVDRAAAAVLVEYSVVPGVRYKVGRVFAYGAQNVSPSRVIETSGVEQGQQYTPALLAEAQGRVYGLGIFSLVQVDPGPFDKRSGTVPVIITVTEAPFITREFGGGLDIDPAAWVIRGRALQTHRNFARGLQKITGAASLGYAFVPSPLSFIAGERERSGLVADLRAEYSQPKVVRSPFDAFVSAEYGKEVIPFTYQRVATRAGAPWKPDWFRRLSVVPSVNFERYFSVGELSGTTNLGALAGSGCGTAVVTGAVLGACNILYGELRVNLDLRDDQISARRGSYFTLSAQYAGTPVSTFSYVRLAPEARGYWTPAKLVTLAARVRYGLVTQVGDPTGPAPPGVANFFAGGATSVRTSGAQQLGPRQFNVVEADGKFTAGAPTALGGDRLLEASVEARWHTGIEDLVLGTFFDLGAVSAAPARAPGSTTLPERPLFPSTYQYGPGVGIRYQTPFGPLRFDVAYRLTQDPETPAAVDVGDSGQSTTPSDYTIKPDCGTNSSQCYSDTVNWPVTGLQFFITLGEAY